MKKLLFCGLLACFCLTAHGQDAALKGKLEASLDKLVRSINEHNFSLIEPLLAEGFTLGGIRCPSTCDAARQAMRQITGPDFPMKIQQAVIKEIKPEGQEFLVTVNFRVKDQDSAQDLVMSAAGQFWDISLPGLKFKTAGQESSEDQPAQAGQGSGCGKSPKGCGTSPKGCGK